MAAEFDNPVYSAFLDGEATPEERARVENDVQESEEIENLIADLGAVSNELQSLPRHELSNDFPFRVLARVEREMLLPAESAQPYAAENWGRKLIPFLAASACLLLVAVVVWTGDRPLSNETRNSGPITQARLKQREVSDQVARNGANVKPKDLTESAPLATRTDRPNKDAEKVVPGAVVDPLIPPLALKSGGKAGKMTFIDDLRKVTQADIGRVITALRPTPNGISVVKLTVIDCNEQTLHAFEVLLAENQIHPQPGKETNGTAGSGADQRGSADQKSGRVLAVYVQSSPEKLAKAMEGMKSDKRFHKLHVDDPVAIASLDQTTRKQLDPFFKPDGDAAKQSGQMGKARRGYKSGGHSKAKNEKPLPAPGAGGASRVANGTKSYRKNAKKNLAAKTPLKFDGKKRAGRDKFGDAQKINEWDRISRQLRLNLPPSSFPKAAQSGYIAKRAGSRQSNGFGGGNFAARPQVAGPTQPVRVLFVLVCRER